MQEKIKILVVGFGRIGERHAGHISNIATLGGIVEPDPLRLKEAKEIYGKKCNYYSSVEEISTNYDLAAICTPNGDHYNSSVQCLKKGMHVLVEKPITLTVNDGLKLLALAEKKNLRVFLLE